VDRVIRVSCRFSITSTGLAEGENEENYRAGDWKSLTGSVRDGLSSGAKPDLTWIPQSSKDI